MARPRASQAASDEVAKEEDAPEPDGTEPIEPLTVVEALSRVMGDVQSISKSSRNQSQNFNFRGIDAVMNAVGPALRRHGVVVVPIHVEEEHEHYETKAREGRSGTAMKNVTLTVRFRFYGPQGDYIDASARGEAADSGDKATAKAHSVAFRTLLLQALCIPTDEPDPDSEAHERVHESGFERGRQDDSKPRERRVEKPPYNYPKDWIELAGRMGNLVGPEEAAVWMSQAAAVATGDQVTPVAEMDEDAKRLVWKVLTETLRILDTSGEGDLQIHPTPRQVISEAFATQLEGQVLNGPTWALTGDEAERGYPAKETVAAEETVPPQEEIEQAELQMDAAAAEAALAEE